MPSFADKVIEDWQELAQYEAKLVALPHIRKYMLVAPYAFWGGQQMWHIPEGYTYDGASIPTLTGLTWVATFSKFNPAVMRAALVHDFFCDTRPLEVSSADAATLFRAMLLEDGVNKVKAWLMYAAVRFLGPQWGVVSRDT